MVPSGMGGARSRSTITRLVSARGRWAKAPAIRLSSVMAMVRPRSGPVQQTDDDGVVQGLPTGLDDVLRDPDGGPGDRSVRGVDQDPGDRAGALTRAQDAHPVVGQMDRCEDGELRS